MPSLEEAPPRRRLPGAERCKWVVLAIVAIGVFMSTLDTSIVNIGLPSIARYFHAPLTGTVEWVIIAYLVAVAALLLTAGRLADCIGHKPIWIVGLALFTLGSAACGLAPVLGALVAARAFQGIGGALLMAISPALLTSAFPSQERGQALGWNAVIVGLGVSAGPSIGGLITQQFTWRWIFFINIPIGILGIAATGWLLAEKSSREPLRWDPTGALLLGAGLAALTMGLSFGQEWGWTSLRLIVTLAVAIAALLLVVPVERRVASPILDLSLFRERAFTSAAVSLTLSFLALFAVSFLLPFYFEQLRGFSVERSGLLLTPLPLTIAVVGPVSGRLADRAGSRWLTVAGMAIACAGLVLVGLLNERSSTWAIVGSLVVAGLGSGLFQSPNNSALMGSAPKDRQGVAAGILATSRVVGQSTSVAVAGAVFALYGGTAAGNALASHAAGGQQAAQATFVHAFHLTFLVAAGVAAIGVLASAVRTRASQPAVRPLKRAA
jgi:EmrB/QacA subfamily drug resistance transporter